MLGGGLELAAVTDHNSMDGALRLQQTLGERVIAGEEIMAHEGEIIGLYLTLPVPTGLSAAETARRIHAQGGLVYIPHPFETVRHGLPERVLDEIARQVDIVEAHNGRSVFQNRGAEAEAWARAHHKAMAASSDAHGPSGWGNTYSILSDQPTRNNLVELLGQARLHRGMVGWRGLLYPKYHRLRRAGRRV
jgi:predicted metal-dependent phosphoesterase TrpH